MMKIGFLSGMLFAASFLGTGTAAGEEISGSWHGAIKITPQTELRLVLNLLSGEDGTVGVTLDSPDQGVYGIPGEVGFVSNDSVSVSVPRIGVGYRARKEDGKLVGEFSQGSLKCALIMSPGKEALSRPQTPVPPFPYQEKEVKVENRADSVMLSGTLVLPEGWGRDTPVVVMVTGSGLQNRDEELFGHKPFAVIADWLARKGIASLRYDDRGCGKSSGNGAVATTADFVYDAAAVVGYLRDNKGFRNVGVLGHSEGAAIAFVLADCGDGINKVGDTAVGDRCAVAKRPDFIVALGLPVLRGDSILADQSEVQLRMGNMPDEVVGAYKDVLLKMYDGMIAEGWEKGAGRIDLLCAEWPATPVYASLKANLKKIAATGNPWLEYFIGFSPAANISRTKCPAFVLYGEKDIQVRPSLHMPGFKSLRPDAVVKCYPDLNHLFQHAASGTVQEYGKIEETISPEVLEDISSYIQSLHE